MLTVPVNVGDALNTTEPVPVLVVTPVPPAKTGRVPAAKAPADVEYRALLAAAKVVSPVPPYAEVIVPPFQVPLDTTVEAKSRVLVPQLTADGVKPYAIHVPAVVMFESNTHWFIPPEAMISNVVEALSLTVADRDESLSI